MKKKLSILAWLSLPFLVGCLTGEGQEERPSQFITDLYQPSDPENIRYLYFPGNNIYYDLDSVRYIFQEENHWKTAKDLPSTYDLIEMWRGEIIELVYRGNIPISTIAQSH